MFGGPLPTLDAVVGQSIVELDVFAQGDQGESLLGTGPLVARARARFAFGWGPSFRVYREDFMAAVTKWFGAQDVLLGHEEFDRRFMVKCRDAEHTALAWSEPARERMADELECATVVSDGQVVEMICPGAHQLDSQLEAMLDVVGALASVGARRLEPYHQLPEVELQPPTLAPRRTFTMSLGTRAGSVRVMTTRVSGEPCLALLALARRELLPFTSELGDGCLAALPEDTLTAEAAPLLSSLRGALLVSGVGGALRLSWSGFPAPEILADGARLLEMLAAERFSVGAFR